MKNVLLTVMGDRDPYPYWTMREEPRSVADTPIVNAGSVVQFLHIVENDKNWNYLKPGKVILLTVEEKDKYTQARVSLLERHLTDKKIEFEHYPLNVADPTDYVALIAAMGKVCIDTQNANPNARFRVLTSPGTPQMLAAWLVLGNEGRLKADFFQKREGDPILDENRKLLHKEIGTINRVKFEAVFEVEAIKSALKMFRRYDFIGAAEQFRKFRNSNNVYRSSVCEYFADVCDIFSSWTILDYTSAARKANELLLPDVNHDILKKFDSNTLLHCKENLAAIENGNLQQSVIDIFCSAERLLHTHNFYDTILRCATAYETMLSRTLIQLGVPVDEEESMHSFQRRLLHQGREKSDRPFPPYKHEGMARINQARLIPEIWRKVKDPRNALIHSGRLPNDMQLEGAAENSVSVTKQALLKFLSIQEISLIQHTSSVRSLAAMANDIEKVVLRE